MYAEYNDFEDATKDWEFSVEFQPEEWKEYQFYIAVEREEPVCTESARKKVRKARGRKAERTREKLHQRVLQSSRNKTSRVQRNFW